MPIGHSAFVAQAAPLQMTSGAQTGAPPVVRPQLQEHAPGPGQQPKVWIHQSLPPASRHT